MATGVFLRREKLAGARLPEEVELLRKPTSGWADFVLVFFR